MAISKRFARAATLSLALLSTGAAASPSGTGNLPYSQCFEGAGVKYGVNADLLRSIAWHESRFNPKANNTVNVTPSEDIGVMQINSWWLDNGLQHYGIDKQALWEPCTNIYTGAWILSKAIAEHKDLWTAVGYYNARTQWKRERYVSHIRQALSDLRDGRMLANYQGRVATGAQWQVKRSETLASIPDAALVALRTKARPMPSRQKAKQAPPDILVISEG